ncbi:glutamate mutase L [Phycicoccus sp. M110.8]|uniref:glutamate mutase L n=1 Tax=Phycicoccus sp. M110.8 TaxID=3075433 RepID=UPI0028FD0A19|nr:glutamate mutase L [Phycicoccus sp. M110.8]MDU0312962.1 glutamate mutase L [Phycicoccus sp. M110.8]
MPLALAVDFGSTFTKAALVDTGDGRLVATASTPTTIGTDVLDGYRAVLGELARHGTPDEVVACSSAGGGLRLAVVGYERDVTAEAGHRVGLSAGARVEHVAAGRLDGAGVAALRASRPDIVLLVGGTDGGNADVLLHNATRLARARVTAPVVVAGNADAADEVAAVLASTGRTFTVTDNVLPWIGVIAPDAARAAIRAAFLHHVIGGKGLSRGPEFGRLVRAATPDAVLNGVEVLADAVGGDVLVVDIGGATTDVYSVITPQGEDAGLAKDVVAPLWHARTVEADLGMRWNAEGVVAAAAREHLPLPEGLEAYAAQLAAAPGHLPVDDRERGLDLALARTAAVVAVRRHARPPAPGSSPRPLADVAVVVGSGGVLRHAPEVDRDAVLAAVATDHAGGWKVPRGARVVTDTAYLLAAVGLLREEHPEAARALASTVVGGRA